MACKGLDTLIKLLLVGDSGRSSWHEVLNIRVEGRFCDGLCDVLWRLRSLMVGLGDSRVDRFGLVLVDFDCSWTLLDP